MSINSMECAATTTYNSRNSNSSLISNFIVLKKETAALTIDLDIEKGIPTPSPGIHTYM